MRGAGGAFPFPIYAMLLLELKTPFATLAVPLALESRRLRTLTDNECPSRIRYDQ